MMAAHTCDQSLLAVGDPSNAYIYRPRTRGFGFRQCVSEISINEYDWKEGTIDLLRTVGVWYCPWCGEVLPGRLNRIYFRLIEQVLGPDEYVVFRHCEELPAEFLDDTWWRTRGIPSDIGKRCSKDERTYDNDSMIVADSCYDDLPGFVRPIERSPHMCDLLKHSFADNRDMIAYLPQTREYGVRILDLDEPVDYQPIRIMPIHYCPWCGDKLPSSLREEWETRLKAEGLEPDDPCIPTNLPEHWGTDQWWRAEGL